MSGPAPEPDSFLKSAHGLGMAWMEKWLPLQNKTVSLDIAIGMATSVAQLRFMNKIVIAEFIEGASFVAAMRKDELA